MAVKISDLLPAPIEVKVAEGKPPLVLRHLELNEMVKLLFSHANDFLAMYAESQEASPNYIKFVSIAPALCAEAISMAADDVDNAKDYRKLPFSVQMVALQQLWKVSVPDPKAFGETLKMIVEELKRLSDEEEKLSKNEEKTPA